MRYQELIREIEAGKVSPVYLFSGEENYLKEESRIVGAIVRKDDG